MDEPFFLHAVHPPAECQRRLRQALAPVSHRGPKRPPELRHVTGSSTDHGGFDLMWAGDRFAQLPHLAVTLSEDGSGTGLECHYHLSRFRWLFWVMETIMILLFAHTSWLLVTGQQIGLRTGGTGSPLSLWLVNLAGVGLIPLNRLLMRRRRPGVMDAERALVEWAVLRQEAPPLSAGWIDLEHGTGQL